MRCFVVAILGFCAGCTTSLAGGANGAMQSDGAATQEVAFAASAGFGDRSGALLLSAHGSIAPDASSGGFVSGYEWLHYGGEFDTIARGWHAGIYGGSRGDRRGASALVTTEYGHHWVLDRSHGDNYGLVSLSIGPSLGVVIPLRDDDRRTAMQLGLGVGVRYDSFSSWRFHL